MCANRLESLSYFWLMLERADSLVLICSLGEIETEKLTGKNNDPTIPTLILTEKKSWNVMLIPVCHV